MTPSELLINLRSRGIRVTPSGGYLVIEPSELLTDTDRDALRAAKPQLLEMLAEDEALAIVRRLRFFSFPTGRMPAAAAVLIRLAPLSEAPFEPLEPVLLELRRIEAELVALGGSYDQELAEAVEQVQSVFPGAKLIEVRRGQLQ
jgi:hypothetical protein